MPSPGDLPDPGIEPRSPALRADALTSEPQGSPNDTNIRSKVEFAPFLYPAGNLLNRCAVGPRKSLPTPRFRLNLFQQEPFRNYNTCSGSQICGSIAVLLNLRRHLVSLNTSGSRDPGMAEREGTVTPVSFPNNPLRLRSPQSKLLKKSFFFFFCGHAGPQKTKTTTKQKRGPPDRCL